MEEFGRRVPEDPRGSDFEADSLVKLVEIKRKELLQFSKSNPGDDSRSQRTRLARVLTAFRNTKNFDADSSEISSREFGDWVRSNMGNDVPPTSIAAIKEYLVRFPNNSERKIHDGGGGIRLLVIPGLSKGTIASLEELLKEEK